MKRKLIFLDIDGTLTPAGNNNPPESAMIAVKAAQAKGHMYFCAQGGILRCWLLYWHLDLTAL